MQVRTIALAGIGLLVSSSAVLLMLGRTDYEVSLDAAIEIWADIARDADFIGLSMTRVSAEREMEIGREIEADILRWFSESTNLRLRAYLEEVGQSLAAHTLRKDIEYRFHVIEAPFINAFAIPGGGVFVTTRMLEFLETEAELAEILGHEISHIDLRHCIERLQYELAARRIVGALGAIVRLAHELVGVGYSEQQELESDRQGILLSADAGYDVVGGLNVFVRLAMHEVEERRSRQSEPPPPTMTGELGRVLWNALGRYLASHPPTPGRARDLATLLERNESDWRGRRFYVGRSNYSDRTSRVSDERELEWVEYTGTPQLIECSLAAGVSVPALPEACTTR
jgi:predicted Zn-dependent protease